MGFSLLPVVYEDVLEALPRVHAVLRPTLLRNWPGLSEMLGCELYLKHENHQPTCSFKVRNGLSVITGLTAEERARGVVAASTGNHGQGIAYAASLLGVRATIWPR